MLVSEILQYIQDDFKKEAQEHIGICNDVFYMNEGIFPEMESLNLSTYSSVMSDLKLCSFKMFELLLNLKNTSIKYSYKLPKTAKREVYSLDLNIDGQMTYSNRLNPEMTYTKKSKLKEADLQQLAQFFVDAEYSQKDLPLKIGNVSLDDWIKLAQYKENPELYQIEEKGKKKYGNSKTK